MEVIQQIKAEDSVDMLCRPWEEPKIEKLVEMGLAVRAEAIVAFNLLDSRRMEKEHRDKPIC